MTGLPSTFPKWNTVPLFHFEKVHFAQCLRGLFHMFRIERLYGGVADWEGVRKTPIHRYYEVPGSESVRSKRPDSEHGRSVSSPAKCHMMRNSPGLSVHSSITRRPHAGQAIRTGGFTPDLLRPHPGLHGVYSLKLRIFRSGPGARRFGAAAEHSDRS